MNKKLRGTEQRTTKTIHGQQLSEKDILYALPANIGQT